MAEDRATTTIALVKGSTTWALSFGNETLIIPAPTAETMARRILGLPETDTAKAALAAALAVGG